MFKLLLEKADKPEIKLPTSAGSSKGQESSSKTYISALLTMPLPLTVWITINCGNFWKRWEYQNTWPASWETYMQVRKQQLELDMEQQTGSKSGKEHVNTAYLTSMQSTSWEMLGWKKHKLESRLLVEISITSDILITPLNQNKTLKEAANLVNYVNASKLCHWGHLHHHNIYSVLNIHFRLLFSESLLSPLKKKTKEFLPFSDQVMIEQT